MKKLFALLLTLLLALSLTACGSSKSAQSADTAYGEFGTAESPSAAPAESEEQSFWDSSAAGETQNGTGAALKSAKMIYTANLELQTLDFEKTCADIASLVESSGGYFEEKNLSNYNAGYRSAGYTVRVPVAQYESFCNQVGEQCHVTWMSNSAENITESYYDTQSRLETAQIKLDRLQELLSKATSMEDIITIESAISETEYDIENLSGTLRHYDALVDYATVHLSLNEVYKLSGTEDAPKTFGQKLGNAFTDGIAATGEFLEGAAVWLAFNWLTLLILAAAVVLAVRALRRVRIGSKPKKSPKKLPGDAPPEAKTEEK